VGQPTTPPAFDVCPDCGAHVPVNELTAYGRCEDCYVGNSAPCFTSPVLYRYDPLPSRTHNGRHYSKAD
jgi:hypothetical protein